VSWLVPSFHAAKASDEETRAGKAPKPNRRTGKVHVIHVRSQNIQRPALFPFHYAGIEGTTVSGKVIQRIFPGGTTRLTAKAESQCYRYLFQLMKENPDHAPAPKPAIEAHCKDEFSGLSQRGFNHQWRQAIAATDAHWSRQGRPRKTLQQKPCTKKS
jgi:hypothetical protein